MSRLLGICGIAVWLLASVPASAQFVAEQVTAGNAALRLFSGTDADGGIGDWYVSNGVVEAIIDDAGPQPDLVPLLGAAAPPKSSEAAFTGGSIIDLARVGEDNDQLAQMFTVGGLSTSNFILYDSIVAVTGPTSASVVASGVLLGFDTGATPVPPANLPVVTEYIAADSDPFLTVRTTVTNTHPTNTAAGLGGFLDAFIWVTRGIVPFSPLPGRGFTHVQLDLSNPAAALELPTYAAGPGNVTPADGIMDPPSGKAAGEVSYGLLGVEVALDPDGPGPIAPTVTVVNTLFGVSSNLISAFGNFPVGSLPAGGVLTYTRRLYVGTRNDVASVADDMIGALATRRGFDTGTISGNVSATDTPDVAASVIATRIGGSAVPGFVDGTPATHFRTDASGAFAGIVLPVGVYDLTVQAVERDPVVVGGVTVTAAADTPVTVPPLSGLGAVEVQILERGVGLAQLVPAKLTFKGLAGTPDPRFRHDVDAFVLPSVGPPIDIQPETFAGGPAQRNFAYVADGTDTLRLRPGRYEVFASRGLEYTAHRRRVRIREGRTRRAKFRVRRVVDTTGVVSADFHIHSARSLDASAPLRDRVASFAGEGVEVMVSTDHDYHVDYTSIIGAMGLTPHITSIVGNEVTTSVPNPPQFPNAIGHMNAWPLPVLPDEPRDGSILDEFVAPNLLFSRLRAQGAQVIQYNHPRAGVSGLTSIGFFNNIGYDPDLPITASPNDLLLDDDILGPGASGVSNPDGLRNIDFDVMEIGNGTSISGYLAVRRDWFSLLNQTDFATVPFIAGTGVSDTHRVTVESAGYFRSYVGRAGDDPATLDVTAFNNNVRAGNVMATTGPFIDFFVEETGGARAGMGQVIAPSTSQVTLAIRVQATNWIPVEEVRVYANGFLAMTFDATTTPAVTQAPNNPLARGRRNVVRFDAQIPVILSADTYFVVEAGAKLSPLPTPPEPAGTIVPGLRPLGFTNPIFVDLAGDGFDPPGLPVMASLSGATEAVPAFARVRRVDASMWARVRSWWHAAVADLGRSGTAHAHGDDDEYLSGKALERKVERQRGEPSEDYFPLYRFRLPDDVVESALEQLPEAERRRIRTQRDATRAP